MPNLGFNRFLACRVILNLTLLLLLLARSAEDVQKPRARRPSSVCRMRTELWNDPVIYHPSRLFLNSKSARPDLTFPLREK